MTESQLAKVNSVIVHSDVTDSEQFLNLVANVNIGEYSDQTKLRGRERKLQVSISKLAATIYTPINSL